MRFSPISTWPGKRTTSRKNSPFRAGYLDTLQLLDRELGLVKAREIVLEVDVYESAVRLDGQLRADAAVRSPGVILSFESRHGPLRFACDTYTAWQVNLRAIGMTLECLRACDRYGATKHAEQYRGWKSLPDTAQPDRHMSIHEAADWLVTTGGGNARGVMLSRDEFVRAYRRACMATHPDRNENCRDGAAFKKVQCAKEVLERHFEGSGQ